MNRNFNVDDDVTQGMGAPIHGCVAAMRQGMTVEDILYRVATVSAVLFILITML